MWHSTSSIPTLSVIWRSQLSLSLSTRSFPLFHTMWHNGSWLTFGKSRLYSSYGCECCTHIYMKIDDWNGICYRVQSKALVAFVHIASCTAFRYSSDNLMCGSSFILNDKTLNNLTLVRSPANNKNRLRAQKIGIEKPLNLNEERASDRTTIHQCRNNEASELELHTAKARDMLVVRKGKTRKWKKRTQRVREREREREKNECNIG